MYVFDELEEHKEEVKSNLSCVCHRVGLTTRIYLKEGQSISSYGGHNRGFYDAFRTL